MAGNKTLDLTIRIAGKMDKSLLSAINGTQSRVSDLAKNISRVGTVGLAAMGTLAAGTVAAIAKCTDAASAFENQMGDVVKYVDGLADANGKISDSAAKNGKTYVENYAAMKSAILDLSTQIPYTAEDLTRLAAAAGQSGKGIDDITGGFLKDAAMWGTAMDVSADQAGDWAAKWEVAFNKSHEEIMTLANQINYLGANNATTAAEIAEVVNDAAALGQVAGMGVDATAALGTAMLAMGVDTAKAANSINRIYTNMSKGSSATKAQQVMWNQLGFTAEGIARSMQTNASGTLLDVFTAIQDLPDYKQVAALSTLFGQWAITGGAKLTGNLDSFKNALAAVNDPSLYEGSMAREFQIKTDTPEAVRQMRDSAWKQLKIGFGESFLPVQKELDTALRDLFVRLNDNMPQLQQLGGTLAELAAGGISKLGEALETALPYVQKALDYVANNGPQAVKTLGAMAGIFAAMQFAPGITGLLGGAGDLLLGEKSGQGSYAVRTGGLAGLWKSGRGAPNAVRGKMESVAGWLDMLKGATLENMGIVGRTGKLDFLKTAWSATAGNTISKSGIGRYFGGIGSSTGNFLNQTGIAGAARGTVGVSGQILSGIAQATGLANVPGMVGSGLSRAGGWIAGKASGLAGRVVHSTPVQAIGRIGGAVINSAPVQGLARGTTAIAGGAAGWLGNALPAGAGLLGGIWGAMASGFGGLLSGALPIVGVISSIIAVVSILGDHLEDIRGIVGKVFGDEGLAVFDSFIGRLQNIGNFISGLFKDGGVAEALAPLRETVVGMFGDGAGAAFDGLVQILQSVMGVAGQVVTFANTTVKPIIQDIFGFITQTVVPILLQTFTSAAPAISGIISGLGSAVMFCMQIIGTAIQAALPIIQNIITVVLSIASVVVPALLGGFEAFSAGISSIVQTVQDIFQGVLTFIKDVFTLNWGNLWQDAVDIFGSIFSGIVGLVKTPVNAVIGAINNIHVKAPDWPILGDLAGKEFGFNIPLLAKGGFTRGPSIAGEAGTEAVISFQKSERARNIDTWMRAGELLGMTNPAGELAGMGNRPAKLLELRGGPGAGAGFSVNFAPQITIQGNADKQVVDRALMEAEARFEAWMEANFERLHNRAERERGRKSYI